VFISIASMKNKKQKRVGRKLNLRKKEDMRSTVREVKDGQRKLRVATRAYNLTLGSLQRRVKGTVSNTGHCSGRKTVLTALVKQAMANHYLLLARRGFPLKRQQLRSLNCVAVLSTATLCFASENCWEVWIVRTALAGRIFETQFHSRYSQSRKPITSCRASGQEVSN